MQGGKKEGKNVVALSFFVMRTSSKKFVMDYTSNTLFQKYTFNFLFPESMHYIQYKKTKIRYRI